MWSQNPTSPADPPLFTFFLPVPCENDVGRKVSASLSSSSTEKVEIDSANNPADNAIIGRMEKGNRIRGLFSSGIHHEFDRKMDLASLDEDAAEMMRP